MGVDATPLCFFFLFFLQHLPPAIGHSEISDHELGAVEESVNASGRGFGLYCLLFPA